MIESGDMPEIVVEECDLDEHVDKKRRRRSRAKAAPSPAQPIHQQGLPIVNQNQQIQHYPNVVAPAPHVPLGDTYHQHHETPNTPPSAPINDAENILYADENENKSVIPHEAVENEPVIEKTKIETPARTSKEPSKSKRTLGKLM